MRADAGNDAFVCVGSYSRKAGRVSEPPAQYMAASGAAAGKGKGAADGAAGKSGARCVQTLHTGLQRCHPSRLKQCSEVRRAGLTAGEGGMQVSAEKCRTNACPSAISSGESC